MGRIPPTAIASVGGRLVLALALLLGGCAKATPAATAPPTSSPSVVVTVVANPAPEATAELVGWTRDLTAEPDAVLTIALSFDPFAEDEANRDPQRAWWPEATWILGQCLSAPLRRVEGEILPDGAAAWEVDEAGTTYTLHLNPKRVWSDGQAVTAQDYRAGLLRTLAPETGSPNASLLLGIAGARAYHEGQAGPGAVGLEAPDDATLRIQLAAPDPDLPLALTTPAAWPARADLDYGPLLSGDLRALPANGYYTVTEYTPHQSLTLTRFDPQPGADQVTVRQARYLFIAGQAERLRAYENGDVDLMWLDEYDAAALDQLPWAAYSLQKEPSQALRVLFFSTRSGPCASVALRRALALATPAELAEQACGVGNVLPADSLVPGLAGPAVPFDPEAARPLVQAAGYGGQPLVILAYQRDRQLLEALAATWYATIGVTATVAVEPYAVYLEHLRVCRSQLDACPYDLVLGRLASPAPDDPRADRYLRLFAGDRPDPLPGGWANGQLDALLVQARAARSAEERMGYLAQAQALLLWEDPALILLYEWPLAYLWAPDLAHVPMAVPRDPPPLPWIRLPDLRKLKALSLEDLAALGEELLAARKAYQAKRIDRYEVRANAAIGALRDWAAQVKPSWKPTADRVSDVAGVLSALADKGSGPVALAQFVYKLASEGKEEALRQDLDQALGQLVKRLEDATQEALARLDQQQLQDVEALRELQRQGKRKELEQRVAGLMASIQATCGPGQGGRRWLVITPEPTAPGSDVIQGEFLIQMAEMLGADLWREHSDYPFWAGYQSPPPPEKYQGYYWQSVRYPAIAERLTQLKYFHDTRPPRLSYRIPRGAKLFFQTVADYESGIRTIAVDWEGSVNVAGLDWRAWGDRLEDWKTFAPGRPIEPQPIQGRGQPTVVLRVRRARPGEPSILRFRALDWSGNEASFAIER